MARPWILKACTVSHLDRTMLIVDVLDHSSASFPLTLPGQAYLRSGGVIAKKEKFNTSCRGGKLRQ